MSAGSRHGWSVGRVVVVVSMGECRDLSIMLRGAEGRDALRALRGNSTHGLLFPIASAHVFMLNHEAVLGWPPRVLGTCP